MKVNSYEELIEMANECKNDIEKLKLLQTYFIENVEFDYIFEFALENSENERNVKNEFSSMQEKIDELKKFEKQFGNNFHFSKADEEKIISIMGEKIEPTQKSYYLFGKEYTSTDRGYNGGIYDCLKRLQTGEAIYEDGLIKKGVCKDFSPFVKKFCESCGIKCEGLGTGDHVFNLINIDGQERIFDYTRMLGIRDDYKNPDNQSIDDWFNMNYEKMFEYKPDRKIIYINDKKLKEPITRLNYKNTIKEIEDELEK